MNSRPTPVHRSLIALTVFAALGSGSAGGVFFAFSSFVMKALARLPPSQGIAAMQSINICVINPSFAFQLFGTAAVCFLLAGWALLHRRIPGAGYLLAGSALYLGVAMLVTFVFNIPLNDALDPLNPNSAEAAHLWSALVPNWTAWNHVRAAGALAAAIAFAIAVLQFGKTQSSTE
jgi:uncharacterized membrane protein